MADIFDQIAGNDASSSVTATSSTPDIFDHLAGNVSEADTQPAGFWNSLTTAIPQSGGALVDSIESIPSGLSNLFQSIFSPKESLDNGTLEKTLRGTGALASATAGAGTGALAGAPLAPFTLGLSVPIGGIIGAAGGLLGYNKLNQLTGSDAVTTGAEDVSNLGTNIGLNAIALPLSMAGGLLTKAGHIVEPIPVEDSMIQQLGISPADVKNAAKFKPTVDGVSPIEQAIAGAVKRGVFSGEDSLAAIKLRNESALSDLAGQVHGPEGILSQVDSLLNPQVEAQPVDTTNPLLAEIIKRRAAQVTPDATVPPVSSLAADSLAKSVFKKPTEVAPSEPTLQAPQLSFEKAQNFISKNPFQAETLSKQFEKRINTINELWDGSVSGLSKVKSYLGNVAYEGTTDSRALDQNIYQDLKSKIESTANKAHPGLGDQVKLLNSQMSEHYALRPIIEKAINKEIAAGYKPEKGGLLNPSVKALLAGDIGLQLAHLSPKVLAVAGAVKLGQKALANRTFSTLASNVLGKSGAALKGAGTIATVLPKVLSQKEVSTPMATKQEDAKALEEIKADPLLKSIARAESNLNPDAKNKESSASGIFQLVKKTAANLGVKDPFSVAESLQGMRKLLKEYSSVAGNDPLLTYAAHYLGVPVLRKLLQGGELTQKQMDQVAYLKSTALPRFKKIYEEESADV